MSFFQKVAPIEVVEPEEINPEEQINIINRVVELPVGAIKPNPNQPRVIFDDYELSQLAVSIQQNGLLQPITVRRCDNDFGYEIISGERRLRAAKLINLEHVPCIIIDTNDQNSAILAILENIQRSNLNYIEEALAIRGLIEHYGITQEDCAAKLGMAQSTVANKLRLLRLTDEEKAMILGYKLNERQARALLKLPSEKRVTAIEKISQAQMNTSQTERFIEEILSEKPETKEKNSANANKKWTFKQVGLYINTFNHAIEAMKNAGIECISSQNKTEDFIEYIVKIPLKQ